MEKNYPAMSIVFSRAAIIGKPDHLFDNEMLIDVLRSARALLDLEPWGDPVEEFFDWTLDKFESDTLEESKNREIRELTRQLTEARLISTEQEAELKQKEIVLNRLVQKLEKHQSIEKSVSQVTRQSSPEPENDRETILRLRNRIEQLKGEIGSQQEKRRRLRERYRLERQKEQTDGERKDARDALQGYERSIAHEKIPKKILIPEYTTSFHRSCESMPSAVVAKALRAVAGFAAHDLQIWRQTRSITRIPNIYRIRIGIHHRLIIQWKSAVCLKVLDLIQREGLRTWVKQHAN
jgi:hypothetical protein